MGTRRTRRTNLLALLALLVLGLLGGWVYYQWRQNRLNNWRVTLHPEHEIPYGAKVLHELLRESDTDVALHVEQRDDLREGLPKLKGAAGTKLYLLLGDDFFTSEADRDSLLRFVSQGNTAFIASPAAYEALADTLELPSVLTSSEKPAYYFTDSLATTYLEESSGYAFVFSDGFDTVHFAWDYFQLLPDLQRMPSAQVRGSFRRNDSLFVNFLEVPYGDGRIFMHSAPLFFANYFLLDSVGYNYANAVFGQLGTYTNIYWDRNSLYRDIEWESATSPQAKESPLRFVLAQRSLAWAYYVLASLLILFVIFQGKRRQRVIPILPKAENTSLAFVQTIGALYFQQHDHRKVALLKRELFLDFIRRHYFMRVTDIQEDFGKELQLQSQLPAETITELLDTLRQLDRQDKLSTDALSQLHHQLDAFYRQCK